jgi:hypothetical protein
MDEVQLKREMLQQHTLLIYKEASIGVASREEVAKIKGHQFNLLRYEFTCSIAGWICSCLCSQIELRGT